MERSNEEQMAMYDAEYEKEMEETGRVFDNFSKEYDYDPVLFDTKHVSVLHKNYLNAKDRKTQEEARGLHQSAIRKLEKEWEDMWDAYHKRGLNKVYYPLLQMRVEEKVHNINKRIDQDGNTLVMIYASLNNMQAVKYLVNHNANIILENNEHKTAIMLTTDNKIREYLQTCLDSMLEPVDELEIARRKNELHPMTGSLYRKSQHRFKKNIAIQLKMIGKKPRAKSAPVRRQSRILSKHKSISGGKSTRKSNKRKLWMYSFGFL